MQSFLLQDEFHQSSSVYSNPLKAQLQKLSGVMATAFIFIYLLYSFRSMFMIRFGVFGLVVPVGFFFFVLLAAKEICDLFSVLTVWSMLDSRALSGASGIAADWQPDIPGEQLESPRSNEPKKVRFVGLPPCPPKRLRRASSTDIPIPRTPFTATSRADTQPPPPSGFFDLLSTLFQFQTKPTFDSADEYLTGAWGSE